MKPIESVQYLIELAFNSVELGLVHRRWRRLGMNDCRRGQQSRHEKQNTASHGGFPEVMVPKRSPSGDGTTVTAPRG